MIFSLGPPTNVLVSRVLAILEEERLKTELEKIFAVFFVIQHVNLVSHSEIIIRNYPVAPLILVWLV